MDGNKTQHLLSKHIDLLVIAFFSQMLIKIFEASPSVIIIFNSNI